MDGAWFDVRLEGSPLLSATGTESNGRVFWGDSGANEGKEVRDLTDCASDDELDMCDGVLRDRTLVASDRWLLVDMSEF